jgi:Pyruvate/2-oxoacid:ferredoxin oxidoreductase delta subunit
MAEREFAVAVDDGRCINCGICMDVCPIRTLDMTRSRGSGAEASFTRGQVEAPVHAWMMAVPVQVDHCNGCTICVRECPTEAISVAAVVQRPALAQRQGPILVEPDGDESLHWMPLSAYTRAAMKVQAPREAHDPWGREPRWRIAKRAGSWQVWRTWSRK